MSELWVFMFCVVVGIECEFETEVWSSYEACMERQNQYIIKHVGEQIITICKRDDDAEIKA